MVRIAAAFSEDDLTRYLQIALDLFRDLQFSLQPRFHLEIGLLKMIQAGKLVEIEQALADLGPRAALQLRPRRHRGPHHRHHRLRATLAPQRTGPSPFELDTLKKTGAAPAPSRPLRRPRQPTLPLHRRLARKTARRAQRTRHGLHRRRHRAFPVHASRRRTADPRAQASSRSSMKEADLQKAIAHLGLPRAAHQDHLRRAHQRRPGSRKKKDYQMRMR